MKEESPCGAARGCREAARRIPSRLAAEGLEPRAYGRERSVRLTEQRETNSAACVGVVESGAFFTV